MGELVDLKKDSIDWYAGVSIRQPEVIFRQEYETAFKPNQTVDPARRGTKAYQVWCEGEIIGELMLAATAIRSSSYTFECEPELASIYGARGYQASSKTITIKVWRRNAQIDSMEIDLARNKDQTLAMFRLKHNVPVDATVSREPSNDTIRFSWLAFDATLDESEILFDLPNFIPISN